MGATSATSELDDELRRTRAYIDTLLADTARGVAQNSRLHSLLELLFSFSRADKAQTLGERLVSGIYQQFGVNRSAIVDRHGKISEFSTKYGVGFDLTLRDGINLPDRDIVIGHSFDLDSVFYDSEGTYVLARLMGESGAEQIYLYADGCTGDIDEITDNITTVSRFASVQYQNLYYRAELERLSLTDGMTGAANRRAHDLRIEQWATEGRTFMYYLVDLDNFKEINDVMGHAEGDRVICEAIQALQSVVREGDLVARYGGDEFAVFCDSADDQMIGRLRTALRVRRINASIGVAISPRDGVTPDEIKKAADVAMYDEKQRHHQQYEAGRPETRRQSDAQRF